MANRTSSNKVVALLAVAGVSTGALWIASSRPQQAVTGEAADATSADSGADASPPGAPAVNPGSDRVAGCAFSEGQTLSYGVRVAGESRLPSGLLGQAGGVPTEFAHDTAATLDLKVLQGSRADAPAVLLAHYRDVRSNALQQPEALDAPFLIKIGTQCELSGFARLSTVPKAHGRTQQALTHELMWQWPTSSGQEELAENGQGSYLARYDLVQAKGQTQVERRVASYNAFWDEEHGAPQRYEVLPKASLLTVTPGAGPWFERMSGREVLVGEEARSETTLTAARKDTPGGAFEGLPTQASAYVWQDLLPQQLKLRQPRPVTAQDIAAREEVKVFTPEESFSRLQKRVAERTPLHRAWPELATYFEARPERTEAVVDLYKQADVTEEVQNAFYIALGNARTAEARQALLAIMESEVAPLQERVRATFALLDRDDVGVELAETLSGHAAHIANPNDKVKRMYAREAALAVGALSGLHDDDPEILKVAGDTVVRILDESDDALVVRPAFGAIANTGDVGLLYLAEQAFQSQDPSMREAAAIAVRRMDPRETSDRVAGWLAREESWDVKRKLYTTVRRQTTTTPVPVTDALVQQAARDLNENPGNITRKAILHILGRAAQGSAVAKETLVAQVPRELEKPGGGMYSVIARYLDSETLMQGVNDAK